MLILGARTRGEKAKTAGHSTWRRRLARPWPESIFLRYEAGVPWSAGARGRREIRRANPMESKDQAYWNDTSRLMWITLGLWLFFGYIVHMFVNVLNKIVIFGFPLGFYMAAQGSLIAFVVILFWFAKTQNNIDRKHGVAEDE
jgi:putative solute:sodium symporter small subunit